MDVLRACVREWGVGKDTSGAVDASEVVDADRESVSEDNVEDTDEKSAEPAEDCVSGEDGVEGRSMPSRSPSMISSSSSVDGKKFRKSSSACHFEAFLNSIQTSMRPGRESAGSSRSRWLVVLRGIPK